MSKELTLVFVYNTDLVKNEYDDPALAVVYFCPSWLSEEKKTTICGQIIGTAHFLKSVFGQIQIINLKNGKFCIREFGKYIMAVGIDQTVPNWILENKVEFLSNLISIFHVDFDHMSTFYKDTPIFIEKLHQMFESCLKFLNLDTFALKLPDLNQPRIWNSFTSQSLTFLSNCLKTKYVLAGLVHWNRKLLATQLNSLLTKCLLLITATKTKLSAESVMTDFQLPKDLQLLQIYVSKGDYEEILQESNSCRSSHTSNSNNKKEIYKEARSPFNGLTTKLFNEWNSYDYCNLTPFVTRNEPDDYLKNELTKNLSNSIDFERVPTNCVNKENIECVAKSLCDPLNPFMSFKGRAISRNMYEKYFSFKKIDAKGKTLNEMNTVCDKKTSSKYSLNKTANSFDSDETRNLQINDEMKECVLFLLNFKDITINLFLEDGAANSSTIINILYEQCVQFVEELSGQLENLDDGKSYSESSNSSQEACSYLFTNHNWEYVHEGGFKDNIDLNTVTKMHEWFINDDDVADIVLRTDKNVIYGHQNENKVVYYQLEASNIGGAPSSTDCMANIIGKARRRLSQTSRSSSLNLS